MHSRLDQARPALLHAASICVNNVFALLQAASSEVNSLISMSSSWPLQWPCLITRRAKPTASLNLSKDSFTGDTIASEIIAIVGWLSKASRDATAGSIFAKSSCACFTSFASAFSASFWRVFSICSRNLISAGDSTCQAKPMQQQLHRLWQTKGLLE